MSRATSYPARLAAFLASMPPSTETWRHEFIFESLADECLFWSIDETREWYRACVADNRMTHDVIPLKDCRQWSICPETGSIVHASGEFFRVDGIRVNASPGREIEAGWDQPILTQVGYDGGILGLLRQRFDGVPHYLVEAKAEPGNYNTVQITSTIQATFSNLKRAHKGHATPYAEYFTAPEANGARVLIDQWMSEDGGRLNNKRNRTMLVELDPALDLPLVSPRYRWISLYQLKVLLRTDDAIIAPHVRGVLALV